MSLRFFNVYGPRSFHKGSVVAAFCKQILQGQPLIVYGDGEQVRDLVFVDDVCDGIMRGLAVGDHGVFQLGSGAPLSLNQLIEALRQVTGPFEINVEFRPNRAEEVNRTWCDVTLVRSVLGFNPDTALNERLARTWQWFLDRNPVDRFAQLGLAKSDKKSVKPANGMIFGSAVALCGLWFDVPCPPNLHPGSIRAWEPLLP